MKQKEVDQLFDYIGEIGPFQILICIISGTIVAVSKESIQINFIAGHMDHWCDVEGVNHLPHSQQKYVAIPQDDDGDYKQCQYFVNNYTQFTDTELMDWNRSEMNPLGSKEATCSRWVYDQSDFYSTFVSRYDLVCKDDWKISLISTFWMFGYLIGTISVGATSDALGRKTCLYLFFTLKLVGCVLSSFAPNYWVLLLGRFLIGLGVTCFLAAYVLLMECVSDKYRSIMANSYWLINVVGSLLAVWSAYIVRDDFYAQVIYTGAQLIIYLFWFVLPESPRWLVVKKKYKVAEKTIRRIAAINKIELSERLQLDKIVKKEKENQPKGTCTDLLRYPRLRGRTGILCLHWFTDSLLFYALQFNTGQLPGNVYINTLLVTLTDIPASLAVLFLLNWSVTGRRWTNAGMLLAAGVLNFCVVAAIMTGTDVATTTLSITGRACVKGAFNAIYVLTPELYPTEIRNVGMGVCSLFARVSGMIAPFAGGPLYDVWDPLPNLLFGVLGFVSGGLTLTLPETLGQPMFETIEQAESFPGKKGIDPAHSPETATGSVIENGKTWSESKTEEGIYTIPLDRNDVEEITAL